MRGPAFAILTLAALGCKSGGAQPEVRHVDLDGDGRTDRFDLGPGHAPVDAPPRGSDPPTTLVLAIDAVPYGVFAELQAEGHFRGLLPASRLVAPFPSLTNVGYTAILRTAPSAGYEDLVFDPATNGWRGGPGDRLRGDYRALAPFHEVFDWEEPHLWGAFAYLVPERVAVAELHAVEEVLGGSGDPELVVYLGSTDPLGHTLGREGLRRHLRRVDRVLDRYLAEGGATRRVVLFSDHGMSESADHRFGLEAALEGAGFGLVDAIHSAADVVAPAFGLVGSIALYTACGAEPAVARAVVGQEGADFAVWLENGRARAVDGSGADPRRRPVAAYPMLAERLDRAVANHTLRPASVLVSLDDGWYWGSELFDRIVDLAGTHGSARASSSIGFLASNVDATPAWLSADDAFECLGLGYAPEPPAAPRPRCLAGSESGLATAPGSD